MPSASIGLMCTCDEDPVPSKAAPATPKAAPAVSKAAPVASSASITAQPPGKDTLVENLATINDAYDNLLTNPNIIKIMDGSSTTDQDLKIYTLMKSIEISIKEAGVILTKNTLNDTDLDTASKTILAVQEAFNQILTDLKIPPTEIKPVELVSTPLTLGGRRTRRKRKGSKKRTRRARRRHR